MDAVFGMLSLQPKTLTVDAAIGGSFYGNSGTRYIFYGNTFQTATGASVTGNMQIEVTEYLNKGDMLFSKMLPISNNEPLISGGEISVVATQNGQPVYLKYMNTFQAHIPQPGGAPSGMEIFIGQPNLDTSKFKANWILAKNDTTRYNIGVVIIKSTGGIDTLNIISDSLTRCNADGFMTSPNYQTFTVTITTTGATLPSTGNVYGYALYDNYKGVWPLYSYNSTDKVFSEHHVPNIPVHFVVFTLINGKFFGGTLAATPATGTNYIVNLTQVDPVTFKTQLNAL